MALTIGVGACGAGGGPHASTIAATGATAVTSAPAGSPSTQATAGSAPVAATAAPTPIGANATRSQSAAAPNSATGAPAAVPVPKSTTPAPAVTAPAPTTPALPARRQPTAAEVNQVIARVHALIPLFTPTPAQITKVGDEVCTAFDQGRTVAQVKATAMQMAGAYAALIPASVTDSAVRTIVTMFCPGYASKLA